MKTIKVWDPFVRVFHWLLVLSMIAQLVTAQSFTRLHFFTGYGIAVLLFFRIVWGFIGSKHARFSDFIYPPREVLAYLKGVAQRQPINYIGHNPAGGAMVIALLLALCLTAIAGLKTMGTFGEGPLADTPDQWVTEAYADGENGEPETDNHDDQQNAESTVGSYETWKTIHVTLVSVVMILVFFHICGVIVSSYVHKENLVLAMLTGKKKEE